ncbi:hypothetical protein Ocin01_12244 [Orchesella cincta]|uniref:Uncharacterized protein n=1 Tax=Orchesella cincta TaxID=48709 RepID=A0A1D2MN18_ORCCI|nr:hypothetical protein Ocin01_12244 [Orchesella cincta]
MRMGAGVVFRTKSSLVDTGFRLSYTSEPVINEKYEGPDVILNNATESVATQIDLPINSSYSGEIHFSIIVATSNSKVISDENTRLKLTLDEQFNNVDRCRTVARVYKWDKIDFYGEMVEGLVEEWVFCADNHKDFLSDYGLLLVVFWTDGVHVGARGSLSTEMVKVGVKI